MYRIEDKMEEMIDLMPENIKPLFAVKAKMVLVKLPEVFWTKLETEARFHKLPLEEVVSYCVAEFLSVDASQYLKKVGGVPAHIKNKED